MRIIVDAHGRSLERAGETLRRDPLKGTVPDTDYRRPSRCSEITNRRGGGVSSLARKEIRRAESVISHRHGQRRRNGNAAESLAIYDGANTDFTPASIFRYSPRFMREEDEHRYPRRSFLDFDTRVTVHPSTSWSFPDDDEPWLIERNETEASRGLLRRDVSRHPSPVNRQPTSAPPDHPAAAQVASGTRIVQE